MKARTAGSVPDAAPEHRGRPVRGHERHEWIFDRELAHGDSPVEPSLTHAAAAGLWPDRDSRVGGRSLPRELGNPRFRNEEPSAGSGIENRVIRPRGDRDRHDRGGTAGSWMVLEDPAPVGRRQLASFETHLLARIVERHHQLAEQVQPEHALLLLAVEERLHRCDETSHPRAADRERLDLHDFFSRRVGASRRQRELARDPRRQREKIRPPVEDEEVRPRPGDRDLDRREAMDPFHRDARAAGRNLDRSRRVDGCAPLRRGFGRDREERSGQGCCQESSEVHESSVGSSKPRREILARVVTEP